MLLQQGSAVQNDIVGLHYTITPQLPTQALLVWNQLCDPFSSNSLPITHLGRVTRTWKSNTANYLDICHEHCFTMAKFNMATELRLIKDTLEHYSQLLPLRQKKIVSCINNSHTLVTGSCTRHLVPLLSRLISIKHFHASLYWRKFLSIKAFLQRRDTVVLVGHRWSPTILTEVSPVQPWWRKTNKQEHLVSCSVFSDSTTSLNYSTVFFPLQVLYTEAN